MVDSGTPGAGARIAIDVHGRVGGGVPVQNFATIPGIGANQTTAQNILNDLSGSLASVRQALNSPGGSNPVFSCR